MILGEEFALPLASISVSFPFPFESELRNDVGPSERPLARLLTKLSSVSGGTSLKRFAVSFWELLTRRIPGIDRRGSRVGGERTIELLREAVDVEAWGITGGRPIPRAACARAVIV